MSATDIAEVTIKINALDQEISACKNKLRDAGLSDKERDFRQALILKLTEQLTALINRRERLEQQLQASAGKFLCIYLFIFLAICI
jgi:transposase